jgi:hypothetical protein
MRTCAAGDGLQPRTQGFSDRSSSGCLWIAPVTCGLRKDKCTLPAVIFGYLDMFCDHNRVPKRSTAHCDTMILWPRVVWHPVGLAEPDHAPAGGSP